MHLLGSFDNKKVDNGSIPDPFAVSTVKIECEDAWTAKDVQKHEIPFTREVCHYENCGVR